MGGARRAGSAITIRADTHLKVARPGGDRTIIVITVITPAGTAYCITMIITIGPGRSSAVGTTACF